MPYIRKRKCHSGLAINAWSNESIQVGIIRSLNRMAFSRGNFRTIFEAENTIRGQHGITDTRNCGHGSGIERMCCFCAVRKICLSIDSIETAEREIKFFFPEFDLSTQSIYANLSANKLTFNRDTLEHQL